MMISQHNLIYWLPFKQCSICNNLIQLSSAPLPSANGQSALYFYFEAELQYLSGPVALMLIFPFYIRAHIAK